MNEQLHAPAREQLKIGLPPRELWLHDLKADGRIETPRDKFGLVDIEKLIELVKSTIHPSYDWESDFDDDHHEYWPRVMYPDLEDAYVNPQEFRCLQINRIDSPRIFHNWLHRITEEPKMPDEEVMYLCVQRERALGALALHISSAKWLMTKSGLPPKSVEEQVNQRVDNFITDLETFRTLPPEFRIERIASYHVDGLEDMLRLEKTLGRRATRTYLTAPHLQLAA